VFIYFITVVELHCDEILKKKISKQIEIMNILFVKQNPAMSIFLRMSSLAFGEIQKDLNLYALQQYLQPPLGEREDLNSH